MAAHPRARLSPSGRAAHVLFTGWRRSLFFAAARCNARFHGHQVAIDV